jgi:acyl-CoA thioester hydrolase
LFAKHRTMHKIITTTIPVRFSDIDAMGHVNNAIYLTYFEEGRKAFLREALNIVDPAEYPFILARISCEYIRPIRLEDPVAVKIWVSETEKKSFKFKYELCSPDNGAILYGSGESVMVMFDYMKKETVAVPDETLRLIKDYCE